MARAPAWPRTVDAGRDSRDRHSGRATGRVQRVSILRRGTCPGGCVGRDSGRLMFDSLHRRRRGRWLARRLRLGGEGADLAYQPPPEYDDALQAPSRDLLERVDVAEVERRLTADERALWDGDTPIGRARLALTLGTHHGVETGLLPDMPPDDVHSMVRSNLVTGGDPWLADLVIGAAGRERGSGGARFRVLVGARSAPSGRLAARSALDRLRSQRGRDRVGRGPHPGRGVVRQARRSRRCRSTTAPSTSSTRSRSGRTSARAPRCAGSPRCTASSRPAAASSSRPTAGTRSATSCAAASSVHATARAACARSRRTATGSGRRSSRAVTVGVADPDWGEAYMSPDWVRRHAEPGWSVVRYEPARHERNQDLYVLERV